MSQGVSDLNLPPDVRAELRPFLEPGESVVDALRSASGPVGRLGELWLIVTDRSIFSYTLPLGKDPTVGQIRRPDLARVRYEQHALGTTLTFVPTRTTEVPMVVPFTIQQRPLVNRLCEKLWNEVQFEVVSPRAGNTPTPAGDGATATPAGSQPATDPEARTGPSARSGVPPTPPTHPGSMNRDRAAGAPTGPQPAAVRPSGEAASEMTPGGVASGAVQPPPAGAAHPSTTAVSQASTATPPQLPSPAPGAAQTGNPPTSPASRDPASVLPIWITRQAGNGGGANVTTPGHPTGGPGGIPARSAGPQPSRGGAPADTTGSATARSAPADASAPAPAAEPVQAGVALTWRRTVAPPVGSLLHVTLATATAALVGWLWYRLFTRLDQWRR